MGEIRIMEQFKHLNFYYYINKIENKDELRVLIKNHDRKSHSTNNFE